MQPFKWGGGVTSTGSRWLSGHFLPTVLKCCKPRYARHGQLFHVHRYSHTQPKKTYITLIPKIPDPMMHFCYKIIPKLRANRLKIYLVKFITPY